MTDASGSESIGNGRMSLETIALLRATPSTERPTIVAPLLANSSCWRAQLTSCPLQYGHQSPRRKSNTTESPRCSESRHGRPFSSSRVKSTGSASMCSSLPAYGALDVLAPDEPDEPAVRGRDESCLVPSTIHVFEHLDRRYVRPERARPQAHDFADASIRACLELLCEHPAEHDAPFVHHNACRPVPGALACTAHP